MNRRDFAISSLSCGAGLMGQAKTIEPDLSKVSDGKGLKVFNRVASAFTDGSRKGIRLNEAAGEGVAYIDGSGFANGAIELDIRGKDVQQQSFVGVAFHGVDGTDYDAIYFRPFNSKADDPARRIRAVQYISRPAYTWQKLRAEHPGQYEKAVNPVPDPNASFHVRIVVASPVVSVFVNGAKDPSLIVTQLSNRGKGLVGFWVDNYGGDFAGLKIIPA